MKLGLHRNISNADYHKQLPPDEHFYSSSQLKTIQKGLVHKGKTPEGREKSQEVFSQRKQISRAKKIGGGGIARFISEK